MASSLGKRVLKWTILVTPWLLALVLALGWGLASWTPGYLETLVPKLAGEMGLPLEEFHIRDAGLFSADVGPVRLGAEDGGLKLSNVHVTYTPASLKTGRVKQVILEGVSLSCIYDGTSFTVPILDLLPKSDSATGTDSALPVLPFDSLVVRDSTLFCSIEGKSFSIPFSATVTPGEPLRVTGMLLPRDQEVRFSGELGPTANDLRVEMTTDGFRLGALGDLLPLSVQGAMDLGLTATIDMTQPQALTSSVQIVINDPDLSALGIDLAPQSVLAANATIAGQSLALALAPVTVTTPIPTTIHFPKTTLSADTLRADFSLSTAGVTLPGTLKADRNDEIWDISLHTANPGRLDLDTGGRAIRLAGLEFSVTGTTSPGKADVIVTAATGGASLGGTEIRSGPVALSLPLAWPAPKRHVPGKLTAANLRYDTYKLGTVSARIRQESMGIEFGGTLFTKLLPDLRVPFSGAASMESRDASLTFDIGTYVLPDEFDPSGLVPAMKDVTLSGRLAVEGGVNISEGGIESRLGVFLTNGTLSLGKERTTSISGIRLYFESPDLLNFRSAPAQMLAFDSMRAGPLAMDKGLVTFQLEPRGVVLVERLGFDWCGGHVASRAFRVVPGHDEYDVTLFASQLRLSTLLNQLGLANAKGEAVLSGELPATWKNGKISFNNGFLHSSPGEGGTIQVDAMEDLVRAIPKGTPEHGQLELARAAIKDFEYKWVRIKADTVGEDLLVRLSLDGKPVSTLPFVYSKEFGGFAKVTGDVKGSNFQGLRLDVNFSLPLDRILLYKDIIKRIQ